MISKMFLSHMAIACLAFVHSQTVMAKADAPAAATSPSGLVTLGAVDAEADDKSTIVNIRFQSKVPWEAAEVEDHGTFIQVSLPQTIIPKPGEFFDGAGPYVRKLATFQTSPNTGAVRLFLTKEAGLIKQALSTDILNDRLMVYIDYAKLETLGLSDHITDGRLPAMPTAAEVVAQTEVRSDIKDPIAMMKGAVEEPASEIGQGDDGMKDKLISVSIFSGIMLIGLLAFYLLKPMIIRRRGGPAASVPAVTMEMIGTFALAPKQKLTLVQVGGEQVLLGVSPDGISYLTTIGRQGSERSGMMPSMVEPSVRRELPAETPHTLTARASSFQAALQDGRAESVKASKAPSRPSRPVEKTANVSAQSKDAAEPVRRPKPTAPVTGAPKSRSISVAIDDAGVRDVRAARREPAAETPAQTIEDVTKLIRRKLKNLPSI